MSTNQ
jgi:hypothetical protein